MTEDYRDWYWDLLDEKRYRELEQEEHERDERIERLYEKGGLPEKPKEKKECAAIY